jgi:putative PIN family toxin of toxin-antitoxin system
MKNTRKSLKVFLDTSVILSGLNSSTGASAAIISLFKLARIDLSISHEVVEEVERVIKEKFPLLRTGFLDFLLSRPKIISKITAKELKTALQILETEDTPILSGALKSKAEYLLTLDKRFQKAIFGKVKMEVLSPGEFLEWYRRMMGK